MCLMYATGTYLKAATALDPVTALADRLQAAILSKNKAAVAAALRSAKPDTLVKALEILARRMENEADSVGQQLRVCMRFFGESIYDWIDYAKLQSGGG